MSTTFNSERLIESVSSDDWTLRVEGAREIMHSRSLRGYRELLKTLVGMPSAGRNKFVRNLRRVLLIIERKIPWTFNEEKMNHGEHMIFHPVTGDLLESLCLQSWEEPCTRRKRSGPFGYPTWGEPYQSTKTMYGQHFLKGEEKLDLIGDKGESSTELSYECGDSYPKHWKFDPWTGVKLS